MPSGVAPVPGPEEYAKLNDSIYFHDAPDDKQVQAAMYGPLVLAVRMGTEGLTNSMIYAGPGPRGFDQGYPMPTVSLRMPIRGRGMNTSTPPPAASSNPEDAIWFEQVEATRRYPLQFQTKGRGPVHSLVPLNQIMDERYSVYVRNEGV